jgi:hypothetical protein
VGRSLRPDGCPKKFIIAVQRSYARVSSLERVWNEQGLRRRTERRLLRVDVHEYHGLDKKD